MTGLLVLVFWGRLPLQRLETDWRRCEDLPRGLFEECQDSAFGLISGVRVGAMPRGDVPLLKDPFLSPWPQYPAFSEFSSEAGSMAWTGGVGGPS